MTTPKKRALSGIKPTGSIHLGNYVGMIKPMLDFAEQSDVAVNLFLADYHSLNDSKARENLRETTHDMACTLLALGLDPNKITFYRQSDVPETFDLFALITNFTPKGLMNRSHAYKAIIQANEDAHVDDLDIGINMGLYNYPILMAADIMLFDTDLVPVGRDQRQHVEFARDIAGSLNAVYGQNVLKLPEAVISEGTMELKGIDGRKMSKSYGNTLPVFAAPEEVLKICKRIKTDSKTPDEPKDADSLIVDLHKVLATPAQHQDFLLRYLGGGMGYGQAKAELAALHEAKFGAARTEYQRLIADQATVDKILLEGAAKARAIAAPVLHRVRQAAGFYVG